MAWIKWNAGLEDRPEVLAMAQALQCDPIHIAGCCMVAWAWGDRELRNGHAPSVNLSHLDRITRVENFGNAMKRVGWIRCDDSGFVFAKWDRHNSKSAKQRALDSARKGRKNSGSIPADTKNDRNSRGKKFEKSKNSKDVASVFDANVGNTENDNLLPNNTLRGELISGLIPDSNRKSAGTEKSKSKSKNIEITNVISTPPPPKGVTADWPSFSQALPEEMRTDAMRAAWEAWSQYRGKLKPTTLKLQAKKLIGFGHDAAIASIEQSIGNSWVGLFPPKDKPKSSKPDVSHEQFEAELKKWA